MGIERPRTLLTVLTAAGVLAVAAVVVMVVVMTRPGDTSAGPGAGATTSPSATPIATPSATPSETPTPTVAPAASEVAMAATGFTVVSDDGSDLYTYAWDDDAAVAVDTLTDVFGSAPEESVVEGDGTHFPDYTSYRWGGFTFLDMIAVEGWKARGEYFQPSYAVLSADSENGIALVPESGLALGASIDDVRALEPDEEVERADGSALVVFGKERTGYEYSVCVNIAPDGTVSEIVYRPYTSL